MADTVETPVQTDEVVEAYTTETPEASAEARVSAIVPAAATGRRKEAIARVRLVPGSGQWKINGRSL
ncbi:30S ribosomal protein S9, partial [Carbonactinospora thermoautotrophica]